VSSPKSPKLRVVEEKAPHSRIATAQVTVLAVPAERPGASGGKRDRNRHERTLLLGQTALGLFLARGLEVVTIDEICHAAAVAKGSYYRYFDDKAALVNALIQPVEVAVRAALRKCESMLRDASDAFALQLAYQSLAITLFPVALTHVDVFRMYLQERAAPAIGARAPIGRLAQIIDEGAIRLTEVAVAKGLLQIDDPRISAYAVVGAIERLAGAMLQGHLDAAPSDILTTLIRLVLDGVRAPQLAASSPKAQRLDVAAPTARRSVRPLASPLEAPLRAKKS
jgi:AcrR family transcriptional regulator